MKWRSFFRKTPAEAFSRPVTYTPDELRIARAEGLHEGWAAGAFRAAKADELLRGELKVSRDLATGYMRRALDAEVTRDAMAKLLAEARDTVIELED